MELVMAAAIRLGAKTRIYFASRSHMCERTPLPSVCPVQYENGSVVCVVFSVHLHDQKCVPSVGFSLVEQNWLE
jgi:hypothetical protein